MKIRFPVLLFLIVMISELVTGIVSAQRLQLHTRDGNRILIDAPPTVLKFNVIDSGETRLEEVAWKNVASLGLVAFQLNQQTQQVEALLEQLSDENYEKRERAEAELSDAEQFGPFESLIRNAAESSDIELNYRLNRVLDHLEEYAGPSIGNFDELILKNGKSLRGDAGDFAFSVKLQGKSVKLSRQNLKQIVASNVQPARSQPQPLKIRRFNQPFPEFYKDEDKLVSFETIRGGESTPLSENAFDMFAFEGLKFQTEDAGYVCTLWYPFKLCPLETGKKCICPFDETGSDSKRLWGKTLITFCLPDQPNVSAGVKKFGVFLEKVDHSRDIVVEAYNSVGQMIGMVEASDQKCVFAGFESNELITCVRILKNSNLPGLSRRVDPSYAIDCVTFEGLEEMPAMYDPVNGSVDAPRVKLGFKDGNQLNVSRLNIVNQQVSFDCGLIDSRLNASLNDVVSMNYARSRRFAASENDYLMVQLDDSSIIKVESDNWRQPFDFLDTMIDEKDVVGLWGGRNSARMAPSDVDSKLPVIVYPGCRILAQEFELREDGISWNKEISEKRVQNVKLFEQNDSRITRPESNDPDFTPDVNQVSFRGVAKIPTIWLREPKTIDHRHGHVFLTDGQYFVLGDESRFKVTKLGSTNVEIEFGKSRKLYPLTRVSSIRLPADD